MLRSFHRIAQRYALSNIKICKALNLKPRTLHPKPESRVREEWLGIEAMAIFMSCLLKALTYSYWDYIGIIVPPKVKGYLLYYLASLCEECGGPSP